MDLSVIVVSHNTRDLLRRCLASIDREFEIIVVDNSSTDGSVEMVQAEFPWVTTICNNSNLGFGAANNQGLEVMEGTVALLLNSDAYAYPGAIQSLLNVMASSEVVACGGRLVMPESEWAFDSVQFQTRLTKGRADMPGPTMAQCQLDVTQESVALPLTLFRLFLEQTMLEKLVGGFWVSKRLIASGPGPHLVDQVMGASMMFRPVEKFDERFFLYCEDTELCHRLRRHGKVLFVPDAVFGHELGASSKVDRWLSVARYNRGKELYFALHKGRLAMAACWLMNRFGSFLRLSAWSLASFLTLFTKSHPRRQARLFWKVLTAPVSGPMPG